MKNDYCAELPDAAYQALRGHHGHHVIVSEETGGERPQIMLECTDCNEFAGCFTTD